MGNTPSSKESRTRHWPALRAARVRLLRAKHAKHALRARVSRKKHRFAQALRGGNKYNAIVVPEARASVSVQLADKSLVVASKELVDLLLISNTKPCTVQSGMTSAMFAELERYASNPGADCKDACDADAFLAMFDVSLDDDWQVPNFDKYILKSVWQAMTSSVSASKSTVRMDVATTTLLVKRFDNFNNLNSQVRLLCNYIVARVPRSLSHIPWLCAQTPAFQDAAQLRKHVLCLATQTHKAFKGYHVCGMFDDERFVYYNYDTKSLYCRYLGGTTPLPVRIVAFDRRNIDLNDLSRNIAIYDPTGNTLLVRDCWYGSKQSLVCNQAGVPKTGFEHVNISPYDRAVLSRLALVVMRNNQVSMYELSTGRLVKQIPAGDKTAKYTHLAASHNNIVDECCLVWHVQTSTKRHVKAYNYLTDKVAHVCTIDDDDNDAVQQIATTGGKTIYVLLKSHTGYKVSTYSIGYYYDLKWQHDSTKHGRYVLPCEAVPLSESYKLNKSTQSCVPQFNMLTQVRDNRYITNVHQCQVVHFPQLNWHILLIGEAHTSYTSETLCWSEFMKELASQVSRSDKLHVYHECEVFEPGLIGGDVVFSLSNMSEVCKQLDAQQVLKLHCWDTRDKQAIQWGKDTDPLIDHLTHEQVNSSLPAYVRAQRERFADERSHDSYSQKMIAYMKALHEMLVSAYNAISLPERIKMQLTVDDVKTVVCDGMCSIDKKYQCALTDIYLFYLLLGNNNAYSMVYGGDAHIVTIHKLLKHFAKVAGISCVTTDIMSKPFAFNTAHVDNVAKELMRQKLASNDDSSDDGNDGGGDGNDQASPARIDAVHADSDTWLLRNPDRLGPVEDDSYDDQDGGGDGGDDYDGGHGNDHDGVGDGGDDHDGGGDGGDDYDGGHGNDHDDGGDSGNDHDDGGDGGNDKDSGHGNDHDDGGDGGDEHDGGGDGGNDKDSGGENEVTGAADDSTSMLHSYNMRLPSKRGINDTTFTSSTSKHIKRNRPSHGLVG